ncbi:MAG TPA: hypothetical protein VGO57_10320 [Verrucomicrobiae bacterium]
MIVVGIFLLVMSAVFLLTMSVSPMNALEAYKKSLRERGEKVEFSELSLRPVPAESNSVEAVEQAFRLFGSGEQKVPYAMQMVVPGKALIGWMQPAARGYNFVSSWDDFIAEEAADRPGIALLHQVLDRPQLDFQLNYKMGFRLVLPQLGPLRQAGQKLAIAITCDLYEGHDTEAATNILTMLGLVQRNETEGLLISHLVRVAMANATVAPTWDFLQSTNVTDTQLASLQKGWEQLNFLNDARQAFRMERPWAVDAIQKTRVSHGEFVKYFGSSSGLMGSGGVSGWEELTEKPRYMMSEAMWRSSWSYTDELRTLQNDTIIIEALWAMQTNQSQCYKADYDAMVARLTAGTSASAGAAFFHALKIPDLGEFFNDTSYASSMVRRMIRMEAARRVVVVAIALKRYQLKHGSWPSSLSELAPEFLASIPFDPFDGKPLRYRPNADGTYLLYCVGDDGVDDGGNPTLPAGTTSSSLNWQKARDWVWPQPATAAEIESFYAHAPK